MRATGEWEAEEEVEEEVEEEEEVGWKERRDVVGRKGSGGGICAGECEAPLVKVKGGANLLSQAAASAGAGDGVESPLVGQHPILYQLPVQLEARICTVGAPVCNNGLIVASDVEHQPLGSMLLERSDRRVCCHSILLLRTRHLGFSPRTTGKHGTGTAHLGIVDRGRAAPAQA